jgi:hypothetical protein
MPIAESNAAVFGELGSGRVDHAVLGDENKSGVRLLVAGSW